MHENRNPFLFLIEINNMHHTRHILPIPRTCIWRWCGRCGVSWHRTHLLHVTGRWPWISALTDLWPAEATWSRPQQWVTSVYWCLILWHINIWSASMVNCCLELKLSCPADILYCAISTLQSLQAFHSTGATHSLTHWTAWVATVVSLMITGCTSSNVSIEPGIDLKLIDPGLHRTTPWTSPSWFVVRSTACTRVRVPGCQK